MSKEKHIEEADVVIDLSGGRLAAQAYRKRINEIIAQLATAKAEIKRKNIAINIAIHLICSDDDYGGDNMIRGIERLEQALEGD